VAAAQVTESTISVQRPYRHLVEFLRPLIVAEPSEPLRIAARPEAIDQDGDVTLLRPQMPPFLMTLGKRCCAVIPVRER
jgi:hypothetical protein